MIMFLENLGFSRKTLEIFKGSFVFNEEQGNFAFPCSPSPNFSCSGDEKLYLDGTGVVPSAFFWEFSTTDDNLVSKVFLFQSAVEAMAFYELKGGDFLRDSALVAVGSSVEFPLISTLKSRFFRASFFLVFPNDFAGRVSDVRVAGFLSGVNVSAKLVDGSVVFRYREREVSVPSEAVSLSKFEILSNVNLKTKTVKARGYRTHFLKLRAVFLSNKARS